MPVRAAVADGGIDIEIIQPENAADEIPIQSLRVTALDKGADYKKSALIDVNALDFHEVVPVAGLAGDVSQLTVEVVLAGHEDEPAYFKLSDLTDELQDCELDSGGPVGINSICGAAGVCRPRPK